MSGQQQSNTTPETPCHSKASTGNASNPSPQEEAISTKTEDRLLNEKAEKYLRESASIEDLPDAQDQQAMDEELGNSTTP